MSALSASPSGRQYLRHHDACVRVCARARVCVCVHASNVSELGTHQNLGGLSG